MKKMISNNKIALSLALFIPCQFLGAQEPAWKNEIVLKK